MGKKRASATDSFDARLLTAAAAGTAEELRQLLDAGFDPNAVHPTIGNSALYNATYSDHVSAVRMLLRRGADPNLRLNYHSPVDGRWQRGIVVLMCARSVEPAQLLIEAGAKVNLAGESGATALMHAVQRANFELIQLLLQAGADPEVALHDGRRAADLVDTQIAFNESFAGGRSNPSVAAKIGRLDDIKTLLTQPMGGLEKPNLP